MGNSIIHFAEVQVNNFYCSQHVDKKCYFVAEGEQVSLTWLALGKSMLAFPHLWLHLISDSFQELVPLLSQGLKED